MLSEINQTEKDKYYVISLICGFHDGSDGKWFTCHAGDLGSVPGSGRSPGEGSGNPLHYSCMGNPVGWRAWWAIVHGVTKSWARQSEEALADFPGSPAVKNPSSSVGDTGSIPGWELRSHKPQATKPMHSGVRAAVKEDLCAATKTWCSQISLKKIFFKETELIITDDHCRMWRVGGGQKE